jgi:hypothetical protein
MKNEEQNPTIEAPLSMATSMLSDHSGRGGGGGATEEASNSSVLPPSQNFFESRNKSPLEREMKYLCDNVKHFVAVVRSYSVFTLIIH